MDSETVSCSEAEKVHTLGLDFSPEKVIMAINLYAVGAKVWLLYIQCFGCVRGRLSFNVVGEVCSYFQHPLFAVIGGSRMLLYDFNTQQTTKHQLPTDVSSGYVQVDRTTVLIVGKEVRALDLLTLKVTPLPPLLTPRDGVGVAQVDNTVFAFGGGDDNNPMTVCEKCSVTPHIGLHSLLCTPCAFHALLYLQL